MTKLSEVSKGDVLIADNWFTCLPAGEHIVHKTDLGLYICCSKGRHYLDGQIDSERNLVGLKKK
jgi:hypothetical protein